MKNIIYFLAGEKSNKLRSLSNRMGGIDHFYCEKQPFVDILYASFTLSDRLERKLKLITLSNIKKKSKNLIVLSKLISKSKKFKSESQYISYLEKIKPQTKKYYSNNKYSKMPKPQHKDNRIDSTPYGHSTGGPAHYLCIECHFSFKGNEYYPNYYCVTHVNKNEHCPNCGVDNSENDKIIPLGSWVRVPKKSASKKKWKNFLKVFVEHKLQLIESRKLNSK